MGNANESAFPISMGPVSDGDYIPGLTKRELFAAMAMQGYLASVGVVGGPVPRDEDIARYSVDTADALLAALEETK